MFSCLMALKALECLGPCGNRTFLLVCSHKLSPSSVSLSKYLLRSLTIPRKCCRSLKTVGQEILSMLVFYGLLACGHLQ